MAADVLGGGVGGAEVYPSQTLASTTSWSSVLAQS
jgi:hypothetical protein